MYKHKTKTSLTYQNPKPTNGDTEAYMKWHEAYFNSQKTALNIKHRINRLNVEFDGDARRILATLLLELDSELNSVL